MGSVHVTGYCIDNDGDAFDLSRPAYFPQNPMDLSTMERHLKAGHYQSREQFREHFTLIMHNCRLYNGPESGEYTDNNSCITALYNESGAYFNHMMR